ncbi:MAG: hypothetical protein ABI663_18470, partial [Chryseolinea sp.]
KTVYEIISSTKEAPTILKNLSEELISIENSHNSALKKLDDEKSAIKSAHISSISFLKTLIFAKNILYGHQGIGQSPSGNHSEKRRVGEGELQ